MDIALNYHNIFLKPKKCIVNSRKECDTSCTLGKHTFDMPVMASNMKSVVDENTCKLFANRNWFYVMHRFNVDTIEFIDNMKNNNYIASISLGVNENDENIIQEMYNGHHIPDYITIDIAHGWAPKCEKMIKLVKDTFGDKVFLIAGNVATPEAVRELEEWGADATKIGIAGGKVCITKNKTGFHIPMVDTIENCNRYAKKPTIADGGIVDHGDIAKALSLGADMIMAGSLFAGYDESAGRIIEINGRHYKEYFGSASQFSKNKYENVEGKKILIEYKGPIEHLLIELKQDLQSSISYAGGKDISALRNTEYVIVN